MKLHTGRANTVAKRSFRRRNGASNQRYDAMLKSTVKISPKIAYSTYPDTVLVLKMCRPNIKLAM